MDNASELEFIQVAHISRLYSGSDLEDIKASNAHILSDRTALLVFAGSVDDLDFLLNDAVVTEYDVTTFRDDLALWVHYAILSELYLPLELCLLRNKNGACCSRLADFSNLSGVRTYGAPMGGGSV